MKDITKCIESLESEQELSFESVIRNLSDVEFEFLEREIKNKSILDFGSSLIEEISKYKYLIDMINEDSNINLNGYYNLILVINSFIEREIYEFTK